MDPGPAIIISAVLASIGWLFTIRSTRLVDRRKHTYGLLLRQLDDPKFAAALDRIKALLEKNNLPDPDDELRQDDISKIDYLLNHYEFLSAAVWCGDIDEKLLRACEYSRITKLFQKTKTYIDKAREWRNQPTMYENLQLLQQRWCSEGLNPGQKAWEFCSLKPSKQWLEFP